jgi:hypothetical protein
MLLRVFHAHADEEVRQLQAELRAQKALTDAKAAERAKLAITLEAHKRDVEAERVAKAAAEDAAHREWSKLKLVTKAQRNQMLSLSRAARLEEQTRAPVLVAPPADPESDEEGPGVVLPGDGAAELEVRN